MAKALHTAHDLGLGTYAPSAQPLPMSIRQPFERRSGVSLEDVRVFRNSAQPKRYGAAAYAYGNVIHLGPGKEHHLRHEAWHTVQQKQGRVAANATVGGLALNDHHALEHEASAPLAALPGALGGSPAAPVMQLGTDDENEDDDAKMPQSSSASLPAPSRPAFDRRPAILRGTIPSLAPAASSFSAASSFGSASTSPMSFAASTPARDRGGRSARVRNADDGFSGPMVRGLNTSEKAAAAKAERTQQREKRVRDQVDHDARRPTPAAAAAASSSSSSGRPRRHVPRVSYAGAQAEEMEGNEAADLSHTQGSTGRTAQPGHVRRTVYSHSPAANPPIAAAAQTGLKRSDSFSVPCSDCHQPVEINRDGKEKAAPQPHGRGANRKMILKKPPVCHLNFGASALLGAFDEHAEAERLRAPSAPPAHVIPGTTEHAAMRQHVEWGNPANLGPGHAACNSQHLRGDLGYRQLQPAEQARHQQEVVRLIAAKQAAQQ